MLGIDTNDLLIAAFFLFIGLVGTAIFVLQFMQGSEYPYNAAESKRPSQIDGWAKSNGYEIRALEKKSHDIFSGYRTIVRAGPFLYQAKAGRQQAYRVVITKYGEEKRRVAWIKVGDDFKVIWEDEWRPSEPPVG